MSKKNKLYEGKAKIIYETENPDHVIQYFKDDATAFDGKKKGSIADKGRMNNQISTRMFQYLEKKGITTHFVESLSEREMLVRKVEIIPIEIVVRNIAAGSLAKRMGIDEGTVLKETIIECYYKDDDLGDPMINDDHIRVFNLATESELAFMRETAGKVNDILVSFFDRINITLVDYKLEFGRFKGEEVILADEISPDGCRLWEKSSGEKMDKDRFRRDLGKVEEAYQEVCNRVLAATE